jgi:hypothetical protein
LKKTVRTPDRECYFVGHSLGCITLLRYLETLKEHQQIGGCVLIAGFISNLGYTELESFFKTPIAWENINKHCRKFVAIHSDDDPYVSLHYGHMFQEKLNAKLIIEHGKKHFSGEDGVIELPSALHQLLRISQ